MYDLKEEEAYNKILELLPVGYIKILPSNLYTDINFEVNGATILLKKLRTNEYLNSYLIDISWGSDKAVFGIPVKAGLDLVSQYRTPLPNLYVINKDNPGEEVYSYLHLQFFYIDKSVLERREL